MVENNKENVQLVISHLEGCAGNFLGWLAVNSVADNLLFRVDTELNNFVLSVNGRDDWQGEVNSRLKSHKVIVTHNFDIPLIKKTFPAAKIIQVYPYTHIGNVLYNISHKKLTLKTNNQIDNHYIDIRHWHNRIQSFTPNTKCYDYWMLSDMNCIKNMLATSLSNNQILYFKNYWNNQLKNDLSLPLRRMSIPQLIKFWQIDNQFTPWMIAWVIYVYEYLHNFPENDRLWSIDDAPNFCNWADVARIQTRYRV